MKNETLSLSDSHAITRGHVLRITSSGGEDKYMIVSRVEDKNTWSVVPRTRKNRIKFWFIRRWDKMLSKFH